MLVKQRIVMHKTAHATQSMMSWFVEDSNGSPPRGIQMLLIDWQDMGSPDSVTITIEPGDLLQDNGEDQ